jgi:hypothetical protein
MVRKGVKEMRRSNLIVTILLMVPFAIAAIGCTENGKGEVSPKTLVTNFQEEDPSTGTYGEPENCTDSKVIATGTYHDETSGKDFLFEVEKTASLSAVDPTSTGATLEGCNAVLTDEDEGTFTSSDLPDRLKDVKPKFTSGDYGLEYVTKATTSADWYVDAPDSVTMPADGSGVEVDVRVKFEGDLEDTDSGTGTDTDDPDGGTDPDSGTEDEDKGGACVPAVDFYDNIQSGCTWEVNGMPTTSDEDRPEDCDADALWVKAMVPGTYDFAATCGDLAGNDPIEVSADDVTYESVYVEEGLPEGALCIVGGPEADFWFGPNLTWRDFSGLIGRVADSVCVPFIDSDPARLFDTVITVNDTCGGLLVVDSPSIDDTDTDTDTGTDSGVDDLSHLIVMTDQAAVENMTESDYDCSITVNESDEDLGVDTPVSHTDLP